MNGSIYQRPGSSFWYFDVAASGKRWRGSTKETDEALAQLFLEAKMKSLEGEAVKKKVTVDSLLDAVEDDMETRGLRGLRNAKSQMVHVRGALGGVSPPSLVTLDVARAYQKERLRAGAAKATIDRELGHLKRGFTLAGLEYPRIRNLLAFGENARQGFLEPAESKKLVAALRKDDVDLGDFVEFVSLTGRRVGEVAAYTFADLNGDVITIRPQVTKGKRPEHLHLAGRSFEIVKGRTKVGIDANLIGLIFHGRGRAICRRVGGLHEWAMNAFRRAAASIGRPDLKPHDLRRSAGRNLVRDGVPQNIAMKITGHRTDAMFRRYDIVSEADQRAALARQR